MRKSAFVLMTTLSLLLSGCGGHTVTAEELRSAYRDMEGCVTEAVVSCEQEGTLWEAELRCEYAPEGVSTVEVLSPETIKGVRASMDGKDWYIEYAGAVLDAGSVSGEEISPAACLPRMLHALREGWLIEENPEELDGVPCVRLCVEERGKTGKVETTLWLRQEDGLPERGELSVNGELFFTVVFTSLVFCDKMST